MVFLLNPTKAAKGRWTLGLLDLVDNPNYIVQSDDLVTVIKDKYPKAKIHYLVIPKEDIPSLKEVTYEHLPLLKHMEKVAKKVIGEPEERDRCYKIGYHAESSLYRLHLHVISDDMNSPFLKTKKHWNSFNTDFFLEAYSNVSYNVFIVQ